MDPTRAISQYVHDQWGAEQGFPAGPVYAIAQTPDGYLWIGTDAGLVRFDGWNFRLVQDGSGVFTVKGVLGLVADKDGSLWIRLQDLSLLRYRNGVFARPVPDAEAYTRIEAMSRADSGEILVWRQESGVFAFRGSGFHKLTSSTGLPQSLITALAQKSNGEVWIGTRDAGLFHFADGRMWSIGKGLPDLKVDSLLSNVDQDLWVGTDHGIVRWDGKQLSAPSVPAGFGPFQALQMVRDRDGNLWIGTDSRGLLRLNSHGLAALSEGDDISRKAVTALFEDREGNLWIGHAGGIERLRDSAFVTYSTPEGLPTNGGKPVFVDSQNRLWFPPAAGGLWWVKDGRHGRVTNDGLDRDVVYSLAGGEGELWVGRQRGGLTRLSESHDAFEAKTYTAADGLAENSVYSVYRARDGTVWAGTLSAGVSMLKDGHFTNYTFEKGLASNTVASILEGSDGTMWFATPSGLSTLSRGRWASYGTEDGLPSENVNCLLEDSTGVLWAGTASGIAFRDHAGFRAPSAVPSDLHAQVLGIAEDKYGWLWMATSSHVLRVNRQKLLRGTLGEGDVREYGLADGLRGVAGVKRDQSVFTDPLGRIWFSLTRGISVVDPARLTRNAAPIVHIQTISADGSPIRTAGEVHIPGGRQRLTFGYVGLLLSDPEQARYRYLLDGFDRSWSDSVATREAVYTNLAPGSYHFYVIASTPDGGPSGQEASIAFAVDPLFWQTWWFRVGIILACAGIILGLYRLRLHQFTRRLNLRFEERLAERIRIAQELHDTLLQGFLSASMQVHVVADNLPADSKAKPTLTRALQLMRQEIEEGRNAVRGLRSSAGIPLDLEHAFARVQQELGQDTKAGEGTEFRVVVEGQKKPLHPLLRDDIYRIGREALINAFRHAKAKNIEIDLRYSPSQLRILVRDDGCGIEPHVLSSGREGHWGLSGMRERAEKIGAHLHVYSRPAAGTEVELSVPGHVAFQGHSEHKLRWFGSRNPLTTSPKHSAAGKGK